VRAGSKELLDFGLDSLAFFLALDLVFANHM
jgi:hypothetical protein